MPIPTLTSEVAERLAGIALGHVTREYPHKADHVMDADGDIYRPRVVHPVFYGSYDWHSCVHGYWLLARLRRLKPELALGEAIGSLLDAQFTADKVERERVYLDRSSASGFERPYGWAWLLMLAAELGRGTGDDGRRWCSLLKPLSDAFVERLHGYLPKLTYPIRAGVHTNTAFALALAAEYAHVFDDTALKALLSSRAEAWFGSDTDAPAWEPSGDDFLSPTLMEAEAMRRLHPAERFAEWFDTFLPNLGRGEPAALLTPGYVSDRSDGKIGHLDGLNLSRAWCWRSLAAAIPEQDDRRSIMLDAAEVHYGAAIDRLTDSYMGEHWLGSFALLATTG